MDGSLDLLSLCSLGGFNRCFLQDSYSEFFSQDVYILLFYHFYQDVYLSWWFFLRLSLTHLKLRHSAGMNEWMNEYFNSYSLPNSGLQITKFAFYSERGS